MRLSNVVALGLLLVCSASNAQQPGPNITLIMEAPITGQPDKVFSLLRLEWPPESMMFLHSHPGDEYGMVIKGAYAVRQMDGQWKTYTAGEGFLVPAGVVHEEKNMTVSTTTIHACVCEKGKKLLQLYTKP
jgi:quercetin dioxygenase-like cupin family protein